MKRGGIIRLLLIDLNVFATAYVNNDREFLYQRGEGTDEDRFVGDTIGDKFVGQAYYYGFGGVKYIYDYGSIENQLRRAGFNSIKKCKYRESKIPGIDKLDNRPGVTLYVEAQK